RSCRRISTSRRNRRNSAASLGLARSVAPVPYCFRHRHNDCSLTCNSSATSRSGRPVSSRNRTASRLYCSSNFRRAFPIGHLPPNYGLGIRCPPNRGRSIKRRLLFTSLFHVVFSRFFSRLFFTPSLVEKPA